MVKTGNTKDNLCVTIDKKILKKFKDHCKDNAINRSRLIEKWIIKFLRGD
jgi:metal-responsive CopG/Arc/MetJ family transcriptional regulator